MTDITYKYLPPGRTIKHVPANNPYMLEARAFALANSLDDAIKTGSVLVQGDEIIGRGANGSDYHKTNVCQRVLLGSKTGEDYDKCEGCHPKNHSEPKAVTDAEKQGYETRGADLYLYGHFWICEDCWNALIDAGVRDVYLQEDCQKLFDKNSKENILGAW